jgi:HsdM-like protein
LASIELSQLESHLWEAANILRGPVDAADFKTYVFPLLFFKRISDVFDEEYAAALTESEGDEEYALFPQNYRFQIPNGCHWNDVRVVTTNVGRALQKAMRGIERANPETAGGRKIAALLAFPFSPAIVSTGYISRLAPMEAHLKPETESRLNELASRSGLPTDDLMEDAMAGYLQEVTEVRQMLDRVKPVEGEVFFESLRQREDELLKNRSPK